MSKNSKNNPNYLKFFQELQVAMEISVKISICYFSFYTHNNHNKDLDVKFDYQIKVILLFN